MTTLTIKPARRAFQADLPPPFALWKWCARTCQFADKKSRTGHRAAGLSDFRAAAVAAAIQAGGIRPDETPRHFLRRALLAFAAQIIATERTARRRVPDNIVDLLAEMALER